MLAPRFLVSARAARSVALCVALCAAHAPGQPAASSGAESREQFESEHFLVDVFDGLPGAAEGHARLLEAAFPEFVRIIGRAPQHAGPIPVRVLPDRAAWLARLRLEGGELPRNTDGVVYWHPTRTVFVERQPLEYETRCKVLHGAFQACHALAKPKHSDLVREWFVLGLAEHLSVHHWNGVELELAADPLVTVPDLAGASFQLFDPVAYDTSHSLWFRLNNDAVRFGLVRYLMGGAPAKEGRAFLKLALGQTGSKLTGYDYASSLGDPKDVSGAVYRWLAEHQEPFRIGLGEWEPVGPTEVFGQAPEKGLALCISRRPLDEITVHIEPVGIGASAGLALDWIDPDNYIWAELDGDWVRVNRFARGEFACLAEKHLRRDTDGSRVMRAVRIGTQVALVVEGNAYGRYKVQTGRLGLVALNGRVRYTGITSK